MYLAGRSILDIAGEHADCLPATCLHDRDLADTVELTTNGTLRMSQCMARQLRFERTGRENLNDLVEGNPLQAWNEVDEGEFASR